MNANQVEVVRAICDDLASTPGVVYAAVERRGSSNIGEAMDYEAIHGGPILADLAEELLPVTDAISIRVIYGAGTEVAEVQTAAGLARRALLRMLRQDDPVGPLVPPGGAAPPSGAASAPAMVSAPRARKAN
jgi:hypothetical protein